MTTRRWKRWASQCVPFAWKLQCKWYSFLAGMHAAARSALVLQMYRLLVRSAVQLLSRFSLSTFHLSRWRRPPCTVVGLRADLPSIFSIWRRSLSALGRTSFCSALPSSSIWWMCVPSELGVPRSGAHVRALEHDRWYYMITRLWLCGVDNTFNFWLIVMHYIITYTLQLIFGIPYSISLPATIIYSSCSSVLLECRTFS